MDMNGDKRFKLHSLNFGKIMCGLVNQLIQYVQKSLICGWHNLFINSGISESLLCIFSPDHLYS